MSVAMASAVDPVTSILRDGMAAGAVDADDADYVESLNWTQTLGTMHLARLGVGVERGPGGLAELFEIGPERLMDTRVQTALSATRTSGLLH